MGLGTRILNSFRLFADGALTLKTKLGIGLPAGVEPAYGIHLLNNNMLFEAGAGQQTAIMLKGDGTFGTQNNPLFSLGRIVTAGVGLPTFRTVYADDSTSERTIASKESSGTEAVISDNTRRSFYEGYGYDGQVNPDFRINGFTGVAGAGVQYEFGRGGSSSTVGNVVRSGSTVTVTTVNPHSFVVGDVLSRAAAPGTTDPKYPNVTNAVTVATVPNTTSFTYTDAGTAGANVQAILHSVETDSFWQLMAKYQLGLIMGGSAKVIFYSGAAALQSGYKLVTGYVDNSGTPGNTTINEISGKAAIAASATACVVTNNTVTTNSQIFVTYQGASEDATLLRLRVSAQSNGSFTVSGNAAATAAVKFSFFVVN